MLMKMPITTANPPDNGIKGLSSLFWSLTTSPILFKYLIIQGVISFLTVILIIPWMIRYLKRIGLVVKEQNKEDKPLIPLSGGLAVVIGIFISIMVYVFIRTFYFQDNG